MEMISLETKHAAIPPDQKKELEERLKPEVGRISAAWGSGYKTEYASLSLSSDQDLVAQVSKAVQEKKGLNPRMMVLVGIGGSNLGALAVYHALKNSCANHDQTLPIYLADTVDARYISGGYAKAEEVLKKGEKILLVIVSKSGGTTETIANAKLFLNLLDRYQKEFAHEQVVCITDEHSPLDKAAQKMNAMVLPIPEKVGGRFSVFSSVGLFPLEMVGVDTNELLEGAASVKDACTRQALDQNPAALSATTLYHFYEKGMPIHDLFLFAMRLRGVGAWYRQLMAESIGKAVNKEGKAVHVGITPTVSVGSIDLHSVAQLYLAGPNNRITTFVHLKNKEDMTVSADTPLADLVPETNGKTLNEIMDAIYVGTQKAYDYQKRPFMSITFPEMTAYYLGQFLQIKMVEIMYLGYLFDINPFDQPQVELYKKETRKILAHE